MDEIDRSQRTGAVIVGGDYRGLGAVRSLGRRRIPVCVATDEHSLAALSRYVTRRENWPTTSDEDQLNFLIDLACERGFAGWTLYPTGDEAAAVISRNHSRLKNLFVLTTPFWETFKWAYDKRLTYTLAAKLDIPHPSTHLSSTRQELEALDVSFPVLLKPSVKQTPSRFTRDKAWLAADRAQMLRLYDKACTMIESDAIMVQEFVPGGRDAQYSFGAVCAEGRPLASIVARRCRQHPIDFGHSSSFVESIEQPEVERLAQKVLREIRFTGLVEVEFKFDERCGSFKLLDINPRLWGWHTLGARAGVDFAHVEWQAVHGAELKEIRARPGVRWIRATTDLAAVFQQLRRGSFSPRHYIRSLYPPLECAIWAADDPIPAICEIPSLIMAKRRLRRSIPHSGGHAVQTKVSSIAAGINSLQS